MQHYLPSHQSAPRSSCSNTIRRQPSICSAVPAVRSSVHADCGTIVYPAYIRGLAYLEFGDSRSAAAQFRKLIDNPGLSVRFVTGPLARLQLARAQKMMGDEAAARSSLTRLSWICGRSADPAIPIYQQAKAEYAKPRK